MSEYFLGHCASLSISLVCTLCLFIIHIEDIMSEIKQEGKKRYWMREGHCDGTRENESECICMHRHRDFLWPYLSFYVLCSWVCGSTTLLMTCRDGGEREGMKKKRAGWGYNSLDCSSKTLSGVTHRRDVLKLRPCEEEVSAHTHTHTHTL